MKIESLERRRPHGVGRVIITAFAAAMFAAMPSRATEVVVQNDTLQDGQAGAICVCFVAGEEAAVWLTAPCSGDIVAVQVFWRSELQNTTQSLEDSIWIYQAGSFPTPGPVMQNGVAPFQDLILEGPVMTDGFLNEFRYLDENQTVPISAPVTAGQTFVVSFKFFNPNALDPFAASVVSDASDCQSGKNAVFAIPDGWINPCLLGLSGDWVIRAVIDCTDPQGACCLSDGSCADDVTSDECVAMNGTFEGPLTTCAGTTCPIPDGACCFMPSGCIDLADADCMMVGGFWQGPGTFCGVLNCFPTGACCLFDGSCMNAVAPDDCAGQGGTYQGDNSNCGAVTCPQPLGACCFSNGSCLNLTESNCTQVPGNVWLGPGTNCLSSNCDPEGACCFTNGSCLELTESECTQVAENVWQGGGSTCDPDPCAVPCTADCGNGDGVVDIVDLLSLLAAWGPSASPCDLAPSGGDGVIDILDLLDLLAGWGPCP